MSACEIEQQGNVAILTPRVNPCELGYEDYEELTDATVEMLDNGSVKHVVIEFDGTDYFGWHITALLVNLGKKTESLGGKMALARLSAQGKEVLRMTKLDAFWTVHSSKEEAIEAVKA